VESIWNRFMSPEKIQGTLEKLVGLGEYADESGYTQSQLALAWTIANKDVSSTILGFSRMGQIDENFKALEFYRKFSNEIEEALEAILKNTPESEVDWRRWEPMIGRRKQ